MQNLVAKYSRIVATKRPKRCGTSVHIGWSEIQRCVVAEIDFSTFVGGEDLPDDDDDDDEDYVPDDD